MTTLETVRSGHVVIGVDTHKHIHVAAAMDTIGGILATLTVATNASGFAQLLDWAAGFGNIVAFGIEGTGSYGATLTSFLRRDGTRSSRQGAQIAEYVERTESQTPSMRRTQPGQSWPASRPRSRRPPMVQPR